MSEGQTQQIQCENPECKKMFIGEIPRAEVINAFSISLVAWSHPDLAICPHCGQGYQMTVKKIEAVAVLWRPVKTQKDATIVTPPPGFRLPQ